MIHFPSGQSPLPLPVDNLGADLLRAAARMPNLTQTPAESPSDTISVKSISAALELGLMNAQNPNSLPAAGAADYQLARVAAIASEPVASMQHLELAVHESPAYASVALQDPAFHAMQGPVQELVDRVTFVAGTSESAPAGTYQPTRVTTPVLMPAPSGDAPAPSEQPVMMNPQSVIAPQLDPTSNPTSVLPAQLASLPALPTQAQPGPAPQLATVLPVLTTSSPALPVQIQPNTSDLAVSPALPAPQASQSVASPPQIPAPSAAVQLPPAITAPLDLELFSSWDTGQARAAAASEYQLAQAAMQAGDRPAALEHLEQAILAHPAQAAAALADSAFDTIKGPVRDLVTRLTVEIRIRTEASVSEARVALQSAASTGMPRPLQLAQAYLDAAMVSYQLGTYTGLVQAAFAADLARKIAEGKISPVMPAVKRGILEPVKRAVKRAATGLWQRLPLLAILLGWFVAGIIAGITGLAFHSGAQLRAWLLPVWAMGLLAMVLLGFVRSIRRIGQRRN